MTIQVAPDDCTGCGICVDVCPAVSKSAVKHKAINMEPKVEHLERERVRWEFFLNDSRSRPHSPEDRHRQGLAIAASPSSSSPAPVPAAARRPT